MYTIHEYMQNSFNNPSGTFQPLTVTFQRTRNDSKYTIVSLIAPLILSAYRILISEWLSRGNNGDSGTTYRPEDGETI